MAVKSDFNFDRVAIYGRNLDEYVKMFNLDLKALRGKQVLDCCSGPAAFACQAKSYGIDVIAVDPIYELAVETIRGRVDNDVKEILKKHADNPNMVYEEKTPTVIRREAMEVFLNDFAKEKGRGRYVVGKLPNLPFDDNSFDMCLCANFLMLYSDIASGGIMKHVEFDYDFHCRAIDELLRITREEVRIYPLHGPQVEEHAYLAPLVERYSEKGFQVAVVPVKQRDIINANHMLSIKK